LNHIQNIEIKNFKSIRHQKIEDCRRVNVFVGYPNTGKSNILEALSLFSIGRAESNFSDYVRLENLTTFFHNGDVLNKSQIMLNGIYRLNSDYKKNKIEIEIEFDKNNYGFAEIDEDRYSMKPQRREAWSQRKYELIDSDKKIRAYNGNQKLNGEDNLIILKYEFKKNNNYTGEYNWSLESPNGNNLFSIISTNRELQKEINDLFALYNLELVYESREQKFSILKRTSVGIFSIPYDLIADTLQRLIFYKAAIASNKSSVLVFEEPEAHMFPPYISKFTSDVMYDENNNQYFIATHSPFVINDFMENLTKDDYSIYIVGYDKETGETLIRRMTDEEVHEIYQFGVDLFLNLENFLPHAQQQ
jgi:AAA15 family ATPase/GTPase